MINRNRLLLKQLQRYEHIRRAASQLYIATGDVRMLVRRQDVIGVIALQMRVVVSGAFTQDINEAVRAMGWQLVKVGNRRFYRSVKLITRTDADAVEQSRQMRSTARHRWSKQDESKGLRPAAPGVVRESTG